MKVFSKSSLTFSETWPSSTSRSASPGEPPRSSSQFADQVIFMSRPEISDRGRATGVCSCSGALVRVS
jgi:hypothetical protein